MPVRWPIHERQAPLGGLDDDARRASSSSGGAVSFPATLVYNEAKVNFRQGQSNSILVIITGPHTDQSLDGSGLQAFIRGTFDPAKPVAINVIDFGADSDRATWESVPQISGRQL